MTIGYNPFDEDFNYGRLDDYKQGFKEGVVALKTQLEGILTQPVEMGYYKKPNKRGKVDKELLLRIVEEICEELVDE